MFTSTLRKSLQASLCCAVLLGSASVQAQTSPINDMVQMVAETLSVEAQALLANTQQDLQLSLKTQLAEAMYDFNTQQSLSAIAPKAANNDEYTAK